jgi:FlaA1/EpsC-like NDP-sugar epimerase
MESNVAACVMTNVLGTERVARTAERYSVGRFVLISSDKAVRPSSVMGASKRLAELVIQDRPPSNTEYVAVRFGNVLGSSGSVIPLFKRQIEAGGPVTVTHPEMKRYFMSIPEAVDLVLQAGVVGKDREVMVLEMGEPVKILDLAYRLIELSGLGPGRDIEIVFTGLRPGEKLHEELMTGDDGVVRTEHKKIWVLRNGGCGMGEWRKVEISLLEEGILQENQDVLRNLMQIWIPDHLMQPRESLQHDHFGHQ